MDTGGRLLLAKRAGGSRDLGKHVRQAVLGTSWWLRWREERGQVREEGHGRLARGSARTRAFSLSESVDSGTHPQGCWN